MGKRSLNYNKNSNINNYISFFIIDAESSIFDPLALRSNVYIKTIVIVHLSRNVSYGSHAVTTLGVFELILLNSIILVYFVTTNIFPPECVGIVNVTH